MKKMLWAGGFVVAVVVFYYLLIRPFEFEVNMTAKTLPGDIIETIRIWNRSIPDAAVLNVDSFKVLNQNIQWKGRRYLYNWNFLPVSDSLTHIEIHISQPGRSFLNKVLIPFTEQEIEQDASEIAKQFYSVLTTHLSITSVKVLGEAQLDSTFCVCRSVTTSQIGKASGMMKNYFLLTTFVEKFKLKPIGAPIVKVTEWDHSGGHLKFDFCFPIARTDSLPDAAALTYCQFGNQRVLKAEYHGNYITSDRAWYALIQYARRHGYKINGLPIEYFYNNPNLGLNEEQWKAEVFLPIFD